MRGSGAGDELEVAAAVDGGDLTVAEVFGGADTNGSCGVNISLALDCPAATVGDLENCLDEVFVDDVCEEDEKPRLVCINLRNWYLFRMYFSSSLSRSESIKSVGGGISLGLKMAFELRLPVTWID